MSHLQEQVNFYQAILDKKLPRDPSALQALLSKFVNAFHGDRSSPNFAALIRKVWIAQSSIMAYTDISQLEATIQQRNTMLVNGAAWFWLTQDCVNLTQTYVSELLQDPEHYESSDNWLCCLVRDVYTNLRGRSPTSYHVSQYLHGFSDASHNVRVPVPRRLPDDLTPVVCQSIVRLLRTWLQFPNNTSMVSGYFVMHLLGTFQNVDVLLLPGVWNVYHTVQASLLQTRLQPEALTPSMLQPFLLALQQHPLANSASPESQVMSQLSTTIHQCFPHLRTYTSLLATPFHKPQLQQQQAISLPLNRGTQSSGSHHNTSHPSPNTNLPHPTTLASKGLQALLAFVRELLPLINPSTHLDTPTSIQTQVLKNQDHFLPFREHAPSRSRVTHHKGPFHPNNIHRPGAFPSAVIFRALLFNSPAIQDLMHGYFATKADWDAFVDKHWDGDTKSLSLFFNIACYGSPQQPRMKGMDYIDGYFAHEAEWNALLERYHGGPVPFLVMVDWLLGKSDVTQGQRNKRAPLKHLPLLGSLTSYLLAADLSYTNTVATPSISEVGTMIFKMKLGSMNGLVVTSQLRSKKAPVETVVEAFHGVYEFLDTQLHRDEKELMGFDTIMVEHLLCKYQRVL